MAIIKELKGDRPIIGERAFIAESAAIIGSVTIGDDCSIWYGAVLRGDVGAIRIGDRVNIQDNAVLHATHQQSECIIGNDVSVGHGANVHGCIIGNDVIIGMGAIVMDNTVVPDGTIIAAGAVVPAGQKLEPGIWAGIPARKIKDGSEAIKAKADAEAEANKKVSESITQELIVYYRIQGWDGKLPNVMTGNSGNVIVDATK